MANDHRNAASKLCEETIRQGQGEVEPSPLVTLRDYLYLLSARRHRLQEIVVVALFCVRSGGCFGEGTKMGRESPFRRLLLASLELQYIEVKREAIGYTHFKT